MLPDCIDPEVGSQLRDLSINKFAENPIPCGHEEIGYARLHWNSCPACRHEFPLLPDTIRKIGKTQEREFADSLSWAHGNFIRDKQELLLAPGGLDDAYIGIIAWLLEMYEEVQCKFGQANTLSPAIIGVDYDLPMGSSGYGASFMDLMSHWFFRSLEPDVQQFVITVALCFEILKPIYEKVERDRSENYIHFTVEEFKQRLHTAIKNSGIAPSAFVVTLELAAKACSNSVADTSATSAVQTEMSNNSLVEKDRTALQSLLEELKQDFNNFQDSMKATQMEMLRQYEHNKRRAADYEPEITGKLGASLYLRLHEQTQRALQLAEYYYDINQEADAFGMTVVATALGYENELLIRVIMPIVNQLRATGVEYYDADGRSRDPLLRGGTATQKGTMLGSLAWYLKQDPTIRSKVKSLGFDIEAISKDADFISPVRNKVVHRLGCDRAVADDLRKRMLCPDGIFSRLHPLKTITPDIK